MKNLLKLTTKAIPTFLKLYESVSYPRHALTCSSFKNFAIQYEKYPEYQASLELYTLNDDWQKDGLFLIKNGRTYYFDSLEPNPFDRVKKMLLDIDYSKEVIFRAVRDQFKPMLNDVFWLNNVEITNQTGTTVYYLNKDFMLKLPQPPIPEGWYYRSLTLDDLPEINQKVIREGGDHLNYIEHTINYKISLGLCDENGILQSWIYGVDVGTHGTLGVAENHKQKGVASAIGVKILKMIAEKHDMDLTWNTEHGNDAAHALSHRYRASNLGTVTWMSVNKRVTNKMSQMGMYQIFYPKL
ncbi:hypothetical protein Bhyg_08960 [Pseudolycoriella hygida]|uniref:Uncharacterized protein n=1 Tax=Pseudolycoriella hygida TaxID=35572 RepID=A0A9Q0S5F8_9DIPT|nr:hypothetical protein Bhyg_08960 [Pseudolycoriella hygida]